MSDKRKAVLVGIAGSLKAFSLSLYNLKAYAYTDPSIRDAWDLHVFQFPLINLSLNFEKAETLAEEIIAQRPELVAVSCYMWNVVAFKYITKILRQRIPIVRIVWGGPEMATDYILEGKVDDYEMDWVISGEGELTFLELLRHLQFGKPSLDKIPGLSWRDAGRGKFTVNEKRVPFRSLEPIPSPYLNGIVDDEVLARHDVEANLETQRGCTLKCSYCIYHKDMSKISYSVIDRIIDEVAFVTNKGVKRIRFVDANFSSDLDHAKAVIRGLIKNKFEAKLMFELIPGFIDEELAALFADYNSLHAWNEITLGIGVQTINYEILKKMRRGIKVDKFEMTFQLIEKYRLYAKIDLIIGLPGEDMHSIERTLEYMIDKLRGSQSHLLCCHVMRGLPGTELIKIAQEYDMVFSSKNEPHEFMESPVLPREQMITCLRRTAVIFRLVNHNGWARREFISSDESTDITIREAFFAAKDRLQISNIALVDLIIEGLMEHLKARKSNFIKPDFPCAEHWWWNLSRYEISNEWLKDYLSKIGFINQQV